MAEGAALALALPEPAPPLSTVSRAFRSLSATRPQISFVNRHDVTQLLPLLDAVPSIQGLRGRPRRKPRRLHADRGCDFDKYRRLLWKRGIRPMIARRGVAQGSGLGKVRWVVERAFAWLRQFKPLRTRYEQRADLHQGLLELACSLICLRRLRTSFSSDQLATLNHPGRTSVRSG